MQWSMKTFRLAELGVPLSKPETRVLELEQALAEGLALAHIGERVLQGCLGGSDGAEADDQALARQLIHEVVETLPLLTAEQVLGRHL